MAPGQISSKSELIFFALPLSFIIYYFVLVYQGAEPPLTNHEGPGCVWTLDYIWFDSANLKATAALETVPREAIEAYVGLPNQFFPSDHLSLKGHFKFAVPLQTHVQS